MMNKLALPIGNASFRDIREWGFYYVDKTPYVWNLAQRPGYYFLSRPRRFGKSLLVDTLHELFAGSELLFQGLHIHDHWDWNICYPVVRLSFDGHYNSPEAIEKDILEQLRQIEHQYELVPATEADIGPTRLRNILYHLHDAMGQPVVVLVDEYDKPILDAMERGDGELARANRDYLRGFYGIIKGCGRYIRFVFITGVSQFSKVSLFSGMNNLNNISLKPDYAAICGYTEQDLETVFAPELAGFDRQTIRDWYNGYHWLGEEKVYNPFDILLLFDSGQFEAHWFETGTPTFLFRVLMEQQASLLALEHQLADKSQLTRFDVGTFGVAALLFQSGYLTIKEAVVVNNRPKLMLGYPNLEVRESLNTAFLEYLDQSSEVVEHLGQALVDLLQANDLDGFRERLSSWLAGIPWRWHVRADVARYEAWYAGLLYACWTATGQSLRVEDASSFGQADLVLLTSERIFVMELKVAQNPDKVDVVLEQAMQQMRTKGYANKYQAENREVHLIAMVFDREQRNVAVIRGERA